MEYVRFNVEIKPIWFEIQKCLSFEMTRKVYPSGKVALYKESA